MSATQKTPLVAVETHEAPNLLHEIIDRMSAIEAKQSRPSPVKLNSWQEIERFAEKAARSGMVPLDYQNCPDKIAIAVQMGSELGLPPLQSLQNIAVIGNRPTVWGDAVPGLIRASGVCAYIKEWSEGSGDAEVWYCEMKRKDDANPVRNKFSVDDAKKAGLWQVEARVTRKNRDGGTYQKDNDSPWFKYQSRMLKMRARGFTARDAFPDVLRGLITTEEARDMVPFEETGLAPLVEEVRQAELAAVRKPTVTEWLKGLDVDLTNAETKDAVDAVLARDDVQRAQDALRNGAKERLDGMIAAAIQRTAPPKSQARTDLEAALARTANRPPIEDPPKMDGESE